MDNIMKELWVDKTLVLANEMVAASLLKAVDVMTAREQLKRHLRTTPEGFALVPVPEWVPFDEFTSYPAPGSSGWFWYIKDDEIFRGTAMQVCLARGVTYWCPADNPPAPPKAPPPKSEPL